MYIMNIINKIIIYLFICVSIYIILKLLFSNTKDNKLVIVHIGKCGGSTVKNELDFKKIPHIHLHMYKAIYKPQNSYIIIIRNPIQRFISAFYWRHYLITNKLIDKKKKGKTYLAPYGNLEGEKDFFNKYNNVNDLCKDIALNSNILDDFKVVNHMNMGIYFYLENLIDTCPRKNILGVICLETISYDMKKIFNINIKSHNKNNNGYSKDITPQNYNILKIYLDKDYQIIEKMYQKGWINDIQYSILKT